MRQSVKDYINQINRVRHVSPTYSRLEPFTQVNGAVASVMDTASKHGQMVLNILETGAKTGLKAKVNLFM